jgi:hypothetical protein
MANLPHPYVSDLVNTQTEVSGVVDVARLGGRTPPAQTVHDRANRLTDEREAIETSARGRTDPPDARPETAHGRKSPRTDVTRDGTTGSACPELILAELQSDSNQGNCPLNWLCGTFV